MMMSNHRPGFAAQPAPQCLSLQAAALGQYQQGESF